MSVTILITDFNDVKTSVEAQNFFVFEFEGHKFFIAESYTCAYNSHPKRCDTLSVYHFETGRLVQQYNSNAVIQVANKFKIEFKKNRYGFSGLKLMKECLESMKIAGTYSVINT